MKKWTIPTVCELDVIKTLGGTEGTPSETSVITSLTSKYNKAQGTMKKAIGKTIAELEATKWFSANAIDPADEIYIREIWDSIPQTS